MRSRGTVVKRGAKYAVVLSVLQPDGTRRREWHSGYGSKRDAERAKTRLLGALDSGTYTAPDRETVGGFLESWLTAHRTEIRGNTADNYATMISAYVNPRIGALRLQAVTPAALTGLYADLLDHGGRSGQGLSEKTVRNVHRLLHRALRDAAAWGVIPRNPASVAKSPTRRQHRTMETWTGPEVRAFLEATASDRLAALWHCAATTGMRRSELCGLQWRDVDLAASRLRVQRVAVYASGTVVFGDPKTERSRRSVSLDAATVTALKEHRRRQIEERLAYGDGWTDHGLVFCREDGTPIPPAYVTRRFGMIVGGIGLPPIRLHDLRHTHATLALEAGVHPKVVSERLGHSSVSITLDTYSHAVPALEAEAAERIAAVVYGP